jgi:hypothetical protein
VVAAVLLIAIVAEVLAGGSPAAPSPAAPPPSPFDERQAYSFLARGPDGTPYRWNPCAAIRYQVDLAGMPRSVVPDIEEAVRLTSQASGLTFEYEGTVDRPDPQELLAMMSFVSPGPDGLRVWSPVLITFAPQRVFRELGARRAIGVAFPVVSRADPDQLVSGLIVINSDARLGPGFDNIESLGPIVEHELGHIVGLGHVRFPLELMNPAPIVRRWNEGDLTGLRRLGSGSCLDVPPADASAAALVPGRG